jgi:hypothetical protein
MKVSGFTFVKNAVKYGYPVAESVRSILPIVDEMVINAGDSEDTTNELLAAINDPKIKTFHSVWDKRLRQGGEVLAIETDKALDATAADSDWLFYIQADEVVHEKDHRAILEAMEKYRDNKEVEGLLFHYNHFYGSFRFIADGRRWYTNEIRIIRNDKSIRAYRDAQGFRKNGRKLNVKRVDATIYHYGWVRNPLVMQEKLKNFGKLWNEDKDHDAWASTLGKQFDYSVIDSVSLFEGTHPSVMKALVEKENWTIGADVKKKNFKNFKHKFLYFLWKNFGWRPFAYRNYKKI